MNIKVTNFLSILEIVRMLIVTLRPFD